MKNLKIEQAASMVEARAVSLEESGAPLILEVENVDQAVSLAAQLVRYIGQASHEELHTIAHLHYNRCDKAKTLADHQACGTCQGLDQAAQAVEDGHGG